MEEGRVVREGASANEDEACPDGAHALACRLTIAVAHASARQPLLALYGVR